MNQKLSEEPVKGQEKVSRLCKLLSNEIQRALGLMKVLRCWGEGALVEVRDALPGHTPLQEPHPGALL